MQVQEMHANLPTNLFQPHNSDSLIKVIQGFFVARNYCFPACETNQEEYRAEKDRIRFLLKPPQRAVLASEVRFCCVKCFVSYFFYENWYISILNILILFLTLPLILCCIISSLSTSLQNAKAMKVIDGY